MLRSEAQYVADIQKVLRALYKPGEVLKLVRVFRNRPRCELCGEVVEIRKCYELENQRSGQRVVSGRHCTVKYELALETLGETPVMVSAAQFDESTGYIRTQSLFCQTATRCSM